MHGTAGIILVHRDGDFLDPGRGEFTRLRLRVRFTRSDLSLVEKLG
jgi:hypothetical protein